MGYCTWYEFSTKNNKYKVEDIISYMKSKMKSDDWFYPFKYSIEDLMGVECKNDFELSPDEHVKWYDHNEEMLELSKQFPDTVFCLHGEGEDTGDLWYCYYKNGKKQYCPAKIVYDDYDETKLC